MQLTPRIVAYIAHEEGLVPEAYYDSDTPPNLTWSMGLTAKTGLKVARYLNRPAPLSECLSAAITHMQAQYLPALAKAFAGHTLGDAQIAAALGFHWNTGAIGHADWVAHWRAGDADAARAALTGNYTQGGALLARRQREAALFFDGRWPNPMLCAVSQVSKPGYHPFKPTAIDIMPALQSIMEGQ